MNEDELTAYHEAGHIIVNATLGRYFCCSQIFRGEQSGRTTYEEEDFLIHASSYALPGVVDHDALKQRLAEPQLSREEAIICAYANFTLEESLMSLVAGTEASLIYATQRGWDTTAIYIEAEYPQSCDWEAINFLINHYGKHAQHEQLLNGARARVRQLFEEEQTWTIVQQFAHLLLHQKMLRWDALDANFQQMLHGLRSK